MLNIMTFNILNGNRRWGGAVASILAERADVVALQEVSHDAARAIGASLAVQYPHQAWRPAADFAGAGLLSRFPIIEDDTFLLSDRGFLCQHVRFQLRERATSYFNVHLKAPRLHVPAFRYDAAVRERELDELDARVARMSEPLIVSGDFNMTDRSPGYRRLTRLLRDAYRDAGRAPGWTFPNPPRRGLLRVPLWPVPFAIIRIDYIFHSAHFVAKRARVGDGDGSDHRPVIATLAYNEL